MKIQTNGDLVSEIRHDLKALNKDGYISARYILSKAYDYVAYLINNRPLFKFFRSTDIFTTATCVEMKRIKSYDCCIAEFRACNEIMRSKKKFPKILNIKGNAIQFVMNMTNGEEYEPLRNAADYNNSKKRQFGNLFKYYYFDDDYLYLLNSTNELVNVNAAFLDQDELKGLSACDKEESENCASKLDNKFICPDEYRSTIKEQLLQIILNRERIPTDERPDMDSNQKTRIQ